MVAVSVLNRPSDGSAPALLVLWRALRALGPTPRDRLLALCAPESVGVDTARKTLTRWTQIGLFIGEENKLRLAAPFDTLELESEGDHRRFRAEVRRLALSVGSNADFLRPEPGGTADLTFALAWLLSTDVNADHLRSLGDIQTFEEAQVSPIGAGDNKYALQNDTRWGGFRDWAAFLGFGWNISPFQLDPTEAVEDELQDAFAGRSELSIESFVAQIAARLPVLDPGEYSVRARERATDGWRPIKRHEVSPALTRAMLRLEDAGRIALESRSDADSRQLLGVAFAGIRSVSHVQLRVVTP
jgi:hypothetical protein